MGIFWLTMVIAFWCLVAYNGYRILVFCGFPRLSHFGILWLFEAIAWVSCGLQWLSHFGVLWLTMVIAFWYLVAFQGYRTGILWLTMVIALVHTGTALCPHSLAKRHGEVRVLCNFHSFHWNVIRGQKHLVQVVLKCGEAVL